MYLKAYDGVSAARRSLAAYFDVYNASRPYQTHDGRTPDMVYFQSLPPVKARSLMVEPCAPPAAWQGPGIEGITTQPIH